MKRILSALTFIFLSLALANCGEYSSGSSAQTTPTDTSSTGSVAAAIGGALNSSTSGGTVTMNENAPKNIWQFLLEPAAYAAYSCPTITSNNPVGTGITNCVTNALNGINLTYNSCTFVVSGAVWNGTLSVNSSGAAFSCGGTLPSFASATVTRQYVDSNGDPSSATRGNLTISHASTITDYASDTSNFITTFNGGYGSQVVHDSGGHINQVSLTEEITKTGLDQTITGNMNVTESVVSNATTWTITSGTMYVYHNLLQTTGTSTFSNVVYNTTCCTPVSGTITTSFISGASERLIFHYCGNATYTTTTTSGIATTYNVALGSCY